MKRRSFLQLSAVGGAATALGISATSGSAASTDTQFSLTIARCTATMIDGLGVPVLSFFGGLGEANPEIWVTEDDEIEISVTNTDDQSHAFAVPGIAGSATPLIKTGETHTISFKVPTGGSFLYVDPYKRPLNRILGLHGAFIVVPRDGMTDGLSSTPYSRARHQPRGAAVFDAMGGGHTRYPGVKWLPGNLERDKLWLFSQVDPALNERVLAGEDIHPATVTSIFVPQYFTINGLSGFDASDHHDGHNDERAKRIMPEGKEGEPCLIRTMNAGLATHAVHIHGNHCFQLASSDNAGNQFCEANIAERDTWMLRPMERTDMLLPFQRPPDVPWGKWPPEEEDFPLHYVMHCHTEMSQTAGGGNYPQGAVTHWVMTEATTRDEGSR